MDENLTYIPGNEESWRKILGERAYRELSIRESLENLTKEYFGNKFFDKVSRISERSSELELNLELGINEPHENESSGTIRYHMLKRRLYLIHMENNMRFYLELMNLKAYQNLNGQTVNKKDLLSAARTIKETTIWPTDLEIAEKLRKLYNGEKE